MFRKSFCVLPLLAFMFMLCQPAFAAKPTDTPAATQKMKPDASKVERLSLRERRAMGLTISGIAQAARELKASGEPVTADAIREKLASKNPSAYAPQAMNWENILAFIERLLPLILKLMDLFAMDLPPVDNGVMLACWFPGQRILEIRPARRILDRQPLRKLGRGVLEIVA